MRNTRQMRGGRRAHAMNQFFTEGPFLGEDPRRGGRSRAKTRDAGAPSATDRTPEATVVVPCTAADAEDGPNEVTSARQYSSYWPTSPCTATS